MVTKRPQILGEPLWQSRWSQPWGALDPWLRNVCMPWARPRKRKGERRKEGRERERRKVSKEERKKERKNERKSVIIFVISGFEKGKEEEYYDFYSY